MARDLPHQPEHRLPQHVKTPGRGRDGGGAPAGHAARRHPARVRALDALEQRQDRHVQSTGDAHAPAGPDAVPATLVLLHLLRLATPVTAADPGRQDEFHVVGAAAN